MSDPSYHIKTQKVATLYNSAEIIASQNLRSQDSVMANFDSFRHLSSSSSLSCLSFYHTDGATTCVFQRVVFQFIARGSEPDVLPVPVCKPEQLHSADQSSIICQPRPPSLLPVHRTFHCHGNFNTSHSLCYMFC